jgi:hypothetical protein
LPSAHQQFGGDYPFALLKCSSFHDNRFLVVGEVVAITVMSYAWVGQGRKAVLAV